MFFLILNCLGYKFLFYLKLKLKKRYKTKISNSVNYAKFNKKSRSKAEK